MHRVRSPLTRLLAFAALVSLSAGLAVPVRADEIADKRAEAQRIASQLDAQSTRLAELAEEFNEARVQSDKVAVDAAVAQAEVALLDRQVAANRKAVREQAVAAYMRGGLSPTSNLDSDAEVDPSRLEQYVAAVIGGKEDALDALQAAKAELGARQAELDAAKARARAAVAEVEASKRAAAAAEAAQRATLGRVQGELGSLVTAESQRRAADESRRAQTALASRQARDTAAPAPGSRSTPTTRGSSPAPTVKQPAGPPPGPPASGASAAVAKAKEQIGKPYEWGAAGPDSFDCSGLTLYAWRAGGRSLPHSSRAQYSATTRVAIEDLVPGDLVFYGNPIHHMGIFVGNGQMVEASQTGTPVRYASIFRRDYAGAGRVN